MVISTVNQVIYNGDGINTAFPYTFRIIDSTDIHLLLIREDGLEVDITSDYYVDVVNSTVHYPGYAPGAEPPEENQPPKLQEGEKLEIYRKLPVTQEKDLGDKWPFYVIELGLDKLTMLIQDVYGWVGRNFLGMANNKWNAKGLPIANVGGPIEINDAATKDYVDRILTGIILDGDTRWVPVDNVAQLKAADIEEGQIAVTLGYHNINDGGAGVYNIRAAELGEQFDDGGTILLDNGNVAELITDKKGANIRQFGAVGDLTTDDTDAFYNALAYSDTVIIPEGTFTIDFRNITLSNKTIMGVRQRTSIIRQSAASANVPFGKVLQNCTIKNLMIRSVVNDTRTDILYFGYSDGNYDSYRNSVVEFVMFDCNGYVVPLHFRIMADDEDTPGDTQYGGCWLGRLSNIYINKCHTGLWFEYEPKVTAHLQWMTGFIAENINIYEPSYYGLRWDAISASSGYQGMWSYANIFRNIQVDVAGYHDGVTGMKIGHGMGLLINPVVFADVQPYEGHSNPVVYSIEFAQNGYPSQDKLSTRIIGGTLEGFPVNLEFAHMNIFNETNLSVRRYYNDPDQYFAKLDKSCINEVMHFDIFNPSFISTYCTLNNATAEYRSDYTGRYLYVKRTAAGQFGISITIPQAKLTTLKDIGANTVCAAFGNDTDVSQTEIANGIPGAYTMPSGYTYSNRVFNGNKNIACGYRMFDNTSFTGDGTITIHSKSNPTITYIKIYDIEWLCGFVGNYYLTERINSNGININTFATL